MQAAGSPSLRPRDRLELKPPQRRFRPPLALRSGHLQTVLGSLWPAPRDPLSQRKLDVRMESLDLGEGDLGVLRSREGTSELVVYLFHGLGGSSKSGYMRACARVLLEDGHTVVAFDHRGCGLGRGLAGRPHHAGATEDLLRVVAYGRRTWPSKRHLCVGFSLSGNDLLLGLTGEVIGGPDLALAVHPPIDLADAADRIARGWGRIYDWRFAWRVLRGARERVRAGRLEKPPEVSFTGGLRAVDDAYTAKAAGFSSREEYYRLCSSRVALADVRVPTVVLSTADDPIVDVELLRSAPRSRFVCLHVEPRGGHMGYLGVKGSQWLPGAVRHYVDALRRIRVFKVRSRSEPSPPSARAAPR